MTSDPAQLEPMRAWLRTVLARYDVSAPDQSGLLTAVGELCTNSIKHAYEGAGGRPIRVSVRAREDRLVIEVEDFGKGFDASQYVEPDLDTLPEHGLGLYLVRQLVDTMSADAGRDRGTRWTLVKYRTPRS
jgi:serine/threonine-protein kinase RsbW